MLSFSNFLKFKFQKTLNPKLWNTDQTLKPTVHDHLITIANAFIDTLHIPSKSITDIVITGSNANYNWTTHSDLDVHILINPIEFNKCDTCSIDVEDCIQTKKILWNDRHVISIYGIPVEVYATTKDEESVRDSGTYSLLKGAWLAKPEKRELAIDSISVDSKATELSNEIDQLIDSQTNDLQDIEEVLNRIARMRQAGLEEAGEYSVENLVFKVLRSSGYLDKIKNYYKQVEDQDLSLA